MKRYVKMFVMVAVVSIMMTAMALSVGATSTIVDTISPIIDSVTDTFSMANIMLILAAAVGAGITFVLAWFGIRKIIAIIMSAVKRGKLSV